MYKIAGPSKRQVYTHGLIGICKRIGARSLLIVWVWCPVAVSQLRLDALPNCASPQQHKSCVITVDRLHPVSPGTIRVWNRTEVVIRIVNKSPFDSCMFVSSTDSKISTRDDTLILSFLELNKARNLLLGTGASSGENNNSAGSDPDDAAIEVDLAIAINELLAAEERLQRFYKTQYVGSRFSTAGLFNFKKDPLSGNDIRDRTFFDRDATATVEQVRASLTAASRASISAGNRLARLNTLIDEESEGHTLLNDSDKRLGSQVASVRRLSSVYQVIDSAQQIVAEAVGSIESNPQPEFELSISLPGEDSTTRSGTLGCRENRTLKQTLGPVPLTIVFRDVPWLVTTVGLAFPSIPSRDFKVQSAPQSVGQNLFAITDRTSRPQVLPFVFLNTKIREFKFRGKQYAINFGPGVGVSSQGQPQFAVGPSESIGRLYVGVGMHIARSTKLINSYHVGDIVPQSFSSPTAPTWEVGFNLSVSYRILPLH